MGVDAGIDITTEERKTVLALLQRHLPGTTAWVYGSRVKWTSRPQSDLDLVVFATPEQRPHVGNLREAFEESNLPFRVDLFVWDEVPDSFRTRIEAEHVALAAAREPHDDERWKEIALGSLVDIYDGPHATPRKTPNGPVFLGISNLASGRLDLKQTEHLSEADYLRWTRRVTPTLDDIVFSYETRLGEAALIPKGLRACLGRRMGLLRPRDGTIDARFLLYAFLGDGFQNTLRSRTVHGSTVDRIPLTEMADFPIYVPQAITEQRAIARILGTLDDKIELNRRMNDTLEAMAGALFKSWFLDFDPVQAKIEGRDTGLPKDIADLFPDRFVEAELGDIPKGWLVKSLDSFGEIITGKTPSTKVPQHFGDEVPFLRIPDMHGRMYVLQTQMMLSNHGASSQYRKTLPPGSVSVSCIATPGLVVLNHRPTQTNQQINSVIPRNEAHSRYLYWLCRRFSSAVKTGGAGGSVLANMNKAAFSALLALDAGSDVIRAFDELVAPMHSSILANEIQSRTLGQVRDTILPKAVSGELRMKASAPQAQQRRKAGSVSGGERLTGEEPAS